jgi:hypothetical protein
MKPSDVGRQLVHSWPERIFFIFTFSLNLIRLDLSRLVSSVRDPCCPSGDRFKRNETKMCRPGIAVQSPPVVISIHVLLVCLPVHSLSLSLSCFILLVSPEYAVVTAVGMSTTSIIFFFFYHLSMLLKTLPVTLDQLFGEQVTVH